MIRANLVAVSNTVDVDRNIGTEVTNDAATVPEELFQKYTETDSRPLTSTPMSASGTILTNRLTQEEFPINCNPWERTTLVLDLRTNSKKQMENETFTWHERDSLGTLEPAPTHRKTEIFISKPISRRTSEHQIRSPELPTDIPDPVPSIEIYDESNSSRNTDESKVKKPSKELTVVRRRGKRLCKGKCRRGSAYGQQTEVCDLLESTETQISHIGNKSTRTSIPTSNGDAENLVATPNRTSAMNNTPSTMLPSFIDANILKHLYRELDNDKIDAEFSVRRKIALQEALRVKGENYSHSKRSQKLSNPVLADLPRVFSRRAVRFEILGSESLHGLTVLEYLSKNVKCRMRNSQRYRIPFEKYLVQFPRYISPDDIYKALGDVMGEPITHEQEAYLKSMIGEIKEPLFVKSWFGLCAAAERLLCRFLPKEKDPATSLQTVDFEIFERRLKFINVDPQLVQFLREIREK
ncbi:PREDICTED: LOW QUALITY PROTEIN: uncharacterized protein LOC108578182 [Habropoda laboriosa]|uniref:LOW QUALITY PROTEIN: uncharacterized protein LOC108578182 n=1 Tax=Habropoda laboriosa TaxID=597456 RepID=UPI00083DD306|nr:PREDICTED: LOW QUALITY PROTEIN: uncharacterized protein LOC108578182 [Habropoda laboriosa]